MYNCVVLVGVTSILLYLSALVYADCQIDPFDGAAPLVLTARNSSILYPESGETTLKFRSGEFVNFACPGDNILLNGLMYQTTVEGRCLPNSQFEVFGKRYFWRDIACNFNPRATVKYTNSYCARDSKMVEIGYDLGNNQFVSIMDICFNTSSQIALYSRYDITASIHSNDETFSRPTFYEDRDLYNLKGRIDTYYKKNRQKTTINNLLGLPPASSKYISNGDFFLSRGHLAAKSDFLYGFQQNATFRYINAAPQWQSFNGGNWNRAERSTRNYADRKKANLQVWTGTYGIATLPHESTQKPTELYLYVNQRTRALPVPALYWKIVYNPSNKRCVVLVGLNNPFEENVSKYIICRDISNSLNWLSWQKSDTRKGYSYACTCNDFKNRVDYAPSLKVSGILN
ncbi:salivary protein Tsal2A-like [Diabrotica undecimpunctata]|uniref:salivary protein Tsal2A-like n=1 Tax=Diabrotica undecimpunctata TaxID=50387 RepID=UPI003B637709